MTNKRRWTIALLLAVGVLVNYFDRVNLSVAEEPLHREFGIDHAAFGLLSSAFNWTYAALQLPMGEMLDRFGVWALGSIGAALWSIASFASAAAPGLRTFWASRLLLGVGEAPTFPANAKAVGLWFPRSERSLATSFFDAAAKLGPAVGVLLVGNLTLKFGWRTSFAVTGVISLGFFLLFALVYRDPANDRKLTEEERQYIEEGTNRAEVGKAASTWYLFRQPKVFGVFLGMGAYNYLFYLALYWLPSYFRSLAGAQQAIYYTSFVWLFAFVMDVLFGGFMVDFLIKRGAPDSGVRRAVMIGGTSLGLCILGALHTHDPRVAMLWIGLAVGGLAAAAPVGWSMPSLIAPPGSVGRVGGIINFGNQISGIAAPIVTGFLIKRDGNYGGAFLVASFVLAVGILSYIFLLGEIKQVPAPTP